MCSTESELFFLITRFLESKPELRDYAEQLRQQLVGGRMHSAALLFFLVPFHTPHSHSYFPHLPQ